MNSIFLFFPFASAALYGLGYILIEKLLKSVSIVTFTFFSALIITLICGAIGIFQKGSFSLSFLSDHKIAWLFAFTVAANGIGWIVTQLALKNTSAEYVSFVELTYPLFTLLFLFLLFGQKQFNWVSLLGGALVLAGAGLMVWAQQSMGTKG